MKALTKGQYEFLARILSMYYPGINVAPYLADEFEKVDPNFKKMLWLKQCGVTE